MQLTDWRAGLRSEGLNWTNLPIDVLSSPPATNIIIPGCQGASGHVAKADSTEARADTYHSGPPTMAGSFCRRTCQHRQKKEKHWVFGVHLSKYMQRHTEAEGLWIAGLCLQASEERRYKGVAWECVCHRFKVQTLVFVNHCESSDFPCAFFGSSVVFSVYSQRMQTNQRWHTNPVACHQSRHSFKA